MLRHVIIRSSAKNKDNLVVLVINAENTPERIKDFATKIFDTFDKVVGITVNLNIKKTNLIMTNQTELLIGKDYIQESLCDTTFKIGSNTFFQVNPTSANNIFKYVKNYIKDNFTNPTLLDAYAGISAFGLVLADVCKNVVSVEECSASVNLAKDVKKLNNIKNIELFNEDCSKYLQTKSETDNKCFDVTILDPPRKGCSIESLKYSLKLTKSKIIYVSCNPATLARDLKILINKGAKIESIQPFDLFCHTYHIENVAIIDVSNCI